MKKSTYIPYNDIVFYGGQDWTFTHLNMPRNEIAKRSIVVWCEQNIIGNWTLYGENGFGFEDPGDALSFKIQFGFGV